MEADVDEHTFAVKNTYFFSVNNKTYKSKSKTHGRILCEIEETFMREVNAYMPGKDKVFIREKGFNSRGSQTEFALPKTIGLMDLCLEKLCPGKEWYEIFPITVKKIVADNVKADKKQVAEAVAPYVGDISKLNDDETDAAAVAIAYLKILTKPEEQTDGTTD